MKMWESGIFDHIGPWIWWVAVGGWAIFIYVIISFGLPSAIPTDINIYVIQPLLWLWLALLAWLSWRVGLEERPFFSKSLLFAAILIGALQVALFIFAGLLFGFVRSPYGHSPLVVLGNLLYVGTTLLGMEMSRAYLVVAFGRRRPLLALGLVCLFFSLLNIPFGKFRELQVPFVFQTVGGTLLPTISENLLATFLAFLGGPVVSIGYRGMLIAFEWLSPIQPNLQWIVIAFLGTLVPALGLLVIHNRFLVEPDSEGMTQPKEGHSATAWVLVAVVAVVLFWFNTGLFGVRPTLIASGSMVPQLEIGDVIITQEVPAENVKVNDIIRFRQEGAHIIHRVVDIQKNGSKITFITRGDANNTDDPPVLANALEGKVVLTVPKIGWVAIGIRQVIARIL